MISRPALLFAAFVPVILLLVWASASAGPGPILVDPPPPGEDAGPILRAAIARALQSGPGAELVLSAGRYAVSTSADGNWHIVIGNATDLRIRGQGARTEIVFGDPRKGGFLIPGGDRVRIADLVIDYDPPPFTQGTIVTVNRAAGQFDLRVDEGFASPDEPWFRIAPAQPQLAVLMDGKQRYLKRGAPDHFFIAGWTPGGPSLWTLRLAEAERGKIASIAAGDRFVLLSRRGNGAFLFADCRACSLEDVIIHASPSLTVALTLCDHITVRGLAITFRPDTPRLIASNGDGIHCQQNRAGPLIEKCLFEGLCDDAVNIYAPPLIVRRVISPTRIAVTRSAAVRAGDTVQVFDPRQGIIRGTPAVLKVVEEAESETFLLDFDKPIEGITPGQDHRSADTVYNLSASGAGYIILDNHMRYHRRHGLLLRGGDGLVENNVFEQVGGHGVCIGNEPAWPEGPIGSNITIRNNRFIGGATSAGYGDGSSGPAIVACGLGLNGLPSRPLLDRIRIEANLFDSPAPSPAIRIAAARGVVLRNNLIGGPNGPEAVAQAESAEILSDRPADRPLVHCHVPLEEMALKCRGIMIATLLAVGRPDFGPPGAFDYNTTWRIENVLRGRYGEREVLYLTCQTMPESDRESMPIIGRRYIVLSYDHNENQISYLFEDTEANVQRIEELMKH